jgi:hypothetical protein
LVLSLAFEHEAGRLRKLARAIGVLFFYTEHAERELKKDSIFKITVENMLRRCSVSKVEDCDGEEGWRAEGKDNDNRRITSIVVPYEEHNEIKIVTGWANGPKE